LASASGGFNLANSLFNGQTTITITAVASVNAPSSTFTGAGITISVGIVLNAPNSFFNITGANTLTLTGAGTFDVANSVFSTPTITTSSSANIYAGGSTFSTNVTNISITATSKFLTPNSTFLDSLTISSSSAPGAGIPTGNTDNAVFLNGVATYSGTGAVNRNVYLFSQSPGTITFTPPMANANYVVVLTDFGPSAQPGFITAKSSASFTFAGASTAYDIAVLRQT
jgi:hypothetical protein